MISTQQVVQSEARDARIARVETVLARQDVAKKLVLFGVDPLAVQLRVDNMTDAELLALDGNLDKRRTRPSSSPPGRRDAGCRAAR
jgi:hypothetical protein